MSIYEKDDYVDHWDKGVGKILSLNGDELRIFFSAQGETKIPSSEARYLKKIDPNGFLASFYEDEIKLREKIAGASPEIIRLLIIDNGGDKIERTRVKLLLGKASASITGWRKDVCFVSDKDWSRWWSKVSKKIAKDSSFDTSTKNVIELNKTDPESLITKFKQHTIVSRKLAIAEQIIDVYDVTFGENILKEINDLVFKCLRDTEFDDDGSAIAFVVFVKLRKKNMAMDIAIDDEDILLIRSVLAEKLDDKQSITLYDYLLGKTQQDMFDHFIIYLFGSSHIKRLVLKNIRTLAFTGNESFANTTTNISKERIDLLEWLSSHKSDKLQIERHSLKNLDAICSTSKNLKGPIKKIYVTMLTLESCCAVLRDTIAKHVSESKNSAVMLGYLNGLGSINTPSTEFVTLFINSFSLNDAIKILSTTIFINEIATRHPALYEAILLKVDSGEILQGLSDNDREKMISQAYQGILPGSGEKTNSLKIRIAALLKNDIVERGDMYGDDELIGVISNKSAFIDERRNAIELLGARRKSDLLMSAGKKLAKQPEGLEWQLLQNIVERMHDDNYSREIISALTNKVCQGRIQGDDFLEFVLQLDCVDQLVDVLMSVSNSAANEQKHVLEKIVNNERIIRAFVRRVLAEMADSSDFKPYVRDKMAPYYSEAMMAAIDAAASMIMNVKTMQEDRRDVLNKAHLKELTKLEKVMDDRVADAISKTKQRYEEHAIKLKKTVEVLDELRARLGEAVSEKIDTTWINICSNKVSMAEEDISLLLKKMGIE